MVDATGRVIREEKRGAIDAKTAQILSRLYISDESWLKLTPILKEYSLALLAPRSICVKFIEHVGLKRVHGIVNAQACMNSA